MKSNKTIIVLAIMVIMIVATASYLYQRTSVNTPVTKGSPALENNTDGVINSAIFNCAENKNIRAIFLKDRVELTLSDGRNLLLSQALAASGARYANTDESFVFWNKGNTAFIEEGTKTTFSDCLEAGSATTSAVSDNAAPVPVTKDSVVSEKKNLAPDLYPLYPNLSWNEESATTSNIFGLDLSGFKTDSKTIKDDKYYKFRTSFNKYYDDKLAAAGWVINKDYAADGAGSSIWGYTKGWEVIILSYYSTALNQKPDQPFSCPCDMTFSIFSGIRK